MKFEINRMYNENCLDTMARMPDNFIDLTVTSPPYDNLRTYNDNIDETWGERTWNLIIEDLYRVTKDGGVVVWVVGDATIDGSETGTSFKQALFFMECGFNLHDTMIWTKDGGGAIGSNKTYTQNFEYMFVFSKGIINTYNLIYDKVNLNYGKKAIVAKGRRTKDGIHKIENRKSTSQFSRRNNYWYIPPSSIKTEHPAIFPEKLAYDHIISWSNEGDLIYDPFMGSGTTAKAAISANRQWIGSEISKEYCDIIEKRLRPLTHNLFSQQ